MRRAGRVSPLLLGVVLGVLVLIVVFFFGKEGPSAAASSFMDALARGDVNGLTKTSFADGKSPEELKQDWQFATQVAAKHYMFRWTITSANVVDDNDATVRLQVERNYGPGSYEENYGLPLQKKDGVWKVNVGEISREMYPALPRPGKA